VRHVLHECVTRKQTVCDFESGDVSFCPVELLGFLHRCARAGLVSGEPEYLSGVEEDPCVLTDCVRLFHDRDGRVGQALTDFEFTSTSRESRLDRPPKDLCVEIAFTGLAPRGLRPALRVVVAAETVENICELCRL